MKKWNSLIKSLTKTVPTQQNPVSVSASSLSSLAKSQDQYDLAKLKELDEYLNLDTFVYEPTSNERRLNFKFIRRLSGSKDPRHDFYLSSFQKVLKTAKNTNIDLSQLFDPHRTAQKLKNNIKPEIATIFSGETNCLSYKYLVNLPDNHSAIQNFLITEKDYLQFQLSSKGLHLTRINAEWLNFHQLANLQPDFVGQHRVFTVSEQSSFLVFSREHFNLKSILTQTQTAESNKTEICSNQIKEFFLSFKDDFSYLLARAFKTFSIDRVSIESLTFSQDQSVLAVSLITRDARPVTILKNLVSDKFADFYMAGRFSLFDFVQNETGLRIVFCRIGDTQVRTISLQSTDFFTVKPISGTLRSVTSYLRNQQQHLRINSIDQKLESSSLLMTLKPFSKIDLLKFGNHNFLRVFDPTSTIPFFFLVIGETVQRVPVFLKERIRKLRNPRNEFPDFAAFDFHQRTSFFQNLQKFKRH